MGFEVLSSDTTYFVHCLVSSYSGFLVDDDSERTSSKVIYEVYPRNNPCKCIGAFNHRRDAYKFARLYDKYVESGCKAFKFFKEF